MTEVLGRWPRKSGALEASERFCGQLALSVGGPHPRHNLQNQSLRMKPSARGWVTLHRTLLIHLRPLK